MTYRYSESLVRVAQPSRTDVDKTTYLRRLLLTDQTPRSTYVTRTRAYAEAVLRLLGPDPNAAEHVLALQRDLGMTCVIYGCDLPHRSNGFCEMHLGRHKRAVAADTLTITRKTKAART